MAGTTISLSSQFLGVQPVCMVKEPCGDLIIVDGLSRGGRWNGRTAALHAAGVDPPTAAPTIALVGSGGMTAGAYDFYYRYIDIDGNPSVLSPIAEATATAGQKPNWSVIADPTNADSRITGKQLWRTTAGQSTTLYYVTELAIGVTTYTSDTSTDAALIAAADANAALRMSVRNPNGSLSANRFVIPPNWASAACWFQDRMWYGAPVVYNTGTATFTSGSATVTGSGTAWTSAMVGRDILYLSAGRFYRITAVASATSLTISTTYVGSTAAGAAYAIRVPHTMRNTLLYSEADEGESVPTTNVVKVQQSLSFTDDEIVGLQCHGSYLYVLKNRSILRLKYVAQPQIDTSITLAAMRGAFSNRCFDMVEDMGYLMDEFGPYRFSGDAVEAIGHPIEDYFRDGTVDFTKSKWFFVKVNPQQEVVRFYVAFSGDTRPKRAFCYHYRLDAWWLEVRHTEIGGACIYPISSRPRYLIGGEADVTLLDDQGFADGLDSTTESGTMYGTATSATATTLTDSGAAFSANVVGCPVAIIDGTGKGQSRIVTARTGTELTVATWTTTPDNTSVYLVGAIEWSWRSRLFQYIVTNKDHERSARLTWQPTTYAAQLDIRRYLNHNTSPENEHHDYDQGDGLSWSSVSAADAVLQLISQRSTIDAAGVNSPGYIRWEFDAAADDRSIVNRWLAMETRGFMAREILKLYALDLEGVQ